MNRANPGVGPASEPQTRSLHYRPDLDGLRAIAVLSVVVFHFRHEWMPGGFLGVDVFFVISGFLITSILLRETAAGTFSILKFYERRVRRIAPALLVFLAVTASVAIVLLLPPDLMGFSQSLLATLAFVANVYFWRDGNYFASAAENKPLLHTWTLSVEEQFYIFFPLLILLLARRSGHFRLAVVAGIAAISLALNVVALHIGASLPAFYLLPTRAWELGAGAVLAMAPSCGFARIPRLAMAVASLGLLLASVMFAPLVVPSPIPEPLPAVVGAVILIWSGTGGQSLIHAGLGWRIPVAIGLISYSLYLWHWPVVVFYHYYTFQDFSYGTAVVAFAFMVAISALSWRFVERPFRGRQIRARTVVWTAAAGAATLAAVAGLAIATRGFPGRLAPEVVPINAAIGTNWRCPFSKMTLYGARYSCLLSTDAVDHADVVMLGNSHAQMYAPLVARIYGRQDKEVLLIPANYCVPLIGYNVRPGCFRIAESNIEAAAKLPNAKEVVIAFTWHTWPELADPTGRKVADGHAAMMEGLDATIDVLQRSGKHVTIIGPIQIPGYDYPSIKSRSLAFGRTQSEPDSIPQAQFMDEMGPFIAHYSARSDITFIEPHKVQCVDASCRFAIGGGSMFADWNHMAEAALPFFEPLFEEALVGPAPDPTKETVR